jgi:hypothetical protein
MATRTMPTKAVSAVAGIQLIDFMARFLDLRDVLGPRERPIDARPERRPMACDEAVALAVSMRRIVLRNRNTATHKNAWLP